MISRTFAVPALAVLAFIASIAGAQQPAATAMPAVPASTCVKPEFPGPFADSRRIDRFNKEYKTYADCIKKYVDETKTTLRRDHRSRQQGHQGVQRVQRRVGRAPGCRQEVTGSRAMTATTQAIAQATLDGFNLHYALFRDCARVAKRQFEAGNWLAHRPHFAGSHRLLRPPRRRNGLSPGARVRMRARSMTPAGRKSSAATSPC